MDAILLKGEPLDGQQVRKLPGDTSQYSTRVAGQRVVYLETGKNDAVSGLPVFVFKVTPDEVKTEDFGDA